LQDLEYLNLAINNITKVQNLQRCESLQRLDLTINFIPKAGLLSLRSLAANYNLRDLFLIGNPCTDWPGYRQYVVAQLPQLAKLVRNTTALATGDQFLLGLPPLGRHHQSINQCYICSDEIHGEFIIVLLC
jgi:protein TilB